MKLIHDHLAPAASLQVVLNRGQVPEGGRHEEELGLRHQKEGNLPDRPAVGVPVVMKLIHDHRFNSRPVTAGKGDVGEDFRRAAEDRGPRVHRRVPRHQAHVVRPVLPAEAEELFIHEGLDRAGVNGPLSPAEGKEKEGPGNERFARSGGGLQDHVPALIEFKDRLLLFLVEFQSARLHCREKALKDGFGPGGSSNRGKGWLVGAHGGSFLN